MMMRRFSVGMLAGVVLAGCESAPPCVGDCATAVIAVGADADVLHPILSSTNVGQAIGHQLFLKLADLGLDLNTVGDEGFVPQAAQSWAWEDSLTLVFTLHPDARWQDGAPVTAQDVAFTFDLYTDSLVNASSRTLLEPIRDVTARDERTVVFTFERTYPEQFYDAVYHLYLLPRHLLDTVPRERFGTHPFWRSPVGNGPYRLASWKPSETVEVQADSMFFLGTPGLARLIWRITPDYTTSLTQVISGDADILEAVIGRDNIERLAQQDHLRLVPYGSTLYAYLGFNLRANGDRSRPHPLFSSREVRQAVARALDRDAILQAVFGEWGKVPGGPVTPVSSEWDDERRQLPFDSALARQMLADLGWRDTDGDGILERNGQRFSFELSYPSGSQVREQASVIIERQLHAVGIEARVTPIEFNAFVERAEQGRFDGIIGAWRTDIPPSAMKAFWHSSAVGAFNYGVYESAAFDSLADLASAARDPERAHALWAQAIEVINNDAPAVWLFTPTTPAAVHRRFENVTIRPDQWAATLWTWRAR